MNQLAHILAKGDPGWIEIVVVALFFGLSIIGTLFQKAKEKKQKNEAADKPRQESSPVRPKPPAIPQARRPRQAPEEQAVRVSQELRMRQQREAQLEAERQRRLAARQSPQSDSNAIEARLVSVRPAEAETAVRQISEIGVILQLDTPAEAQRAIVMHEIFSPPKALRQGGEMWDA